MNIAQILNESTGLANRRVGDVFVNENTGEEIIFQDLRFFPESGAYQDPKELVAAIEDLESKILGNIQWVNAYRKNGAFAVAYFESPGGPRYFGRYFGEIKPYFKSNFWDNNELLGFKFKKPSSMKTRSGYYPVDILPNTLGQTPQSILAAVELRFGKRHPLTQVTRYVSEGLPLPMSILSEGIDVTAFRDVFCELLQPIALMRGLYTGNAAEAEKKFLQGSTYASCTINFNTSKTSGLYDSVLVAPNGAMVRLSTKGGVGAEASAMNLFQSASEILASPSKNLLKDYQREFEILQIIDSSNYVAGPLKLGIKFGFINTQEFSIIVELLKNPRSTIKLTTNLQALLKARMSISRDKGQIHKGFALLAAVAHLVADYVNNNTQFNNFATIALNNGALVQCYTTVSSSKDTIILAGFDTKFPSKLTSSVSLSASKTYYNTGNKGKFTFLISGV